MIRANRIIPKCTNVRQYTASAGTVVVKRDVIPKALRSAVWMKYIGNKFESKCYVDWCLIDINPFTFEVGHNIPQSKGGKTTIDNLRPICSQCNKSMGNRYSIIEFSQMFEEEKNNQEEIRPLKRRRIIASCLCQ